MQEVLNRVSRRRHSDQKGFTLIELLVVIAVLAVLAAIVVFNVTGVTDKGKTSACQTDLHTVQTASDAYYNANGSYAANVNALSPVYIHNVPTDLGAVTINADGHGGVTAANC